MARVVSLSLKSWHLSVLSSNFDKFVGLDDSFFFFIEVLNSKNVKVYWERKGKADVTGANQLAFDGIPYVHIGEKILWCHQGKDKRKKKRSAGYKVICKNLSFLWGLFYENCLTTTTTTILIIIIIIIIKGYI